jgi:hypothetical protein
MLQWARHTTRVGGIVLSVTVAVNRVLHLWMVSHLDDAWSDCQVSGGSHRVPLGRAVCGMSPRRHRFPNLGNSYGVGQVWELPRRAPCCPQFISAASANCTRARPSGDVRAGAASSSYHIVPHRTVPYPSTLRARFKFLYRRVPGQVRKFRSTRTSLYEGLLCTGVRGLNRSMYDCQVLHGPCAPGPQPCWSAHSDR